MTMYDRQKEVEFTEATVREAGAKSAELMNGLLNGGSVLGDQLTRDINDLTMLSYEATHTYNYALLRCIHLAEHYAPQVYTPVLDAVKAEAEPEGVTHRFNCTECDWSIKTTSPAPYRMTCPKCKSQLKKVPRIVEVTQGVPITEYREVEGRELDRLEEKAYVLDRILEAREADRARYREAQNIPGDQKVGPVSEMFGVDVASILDQYEDDNIQKEG